jgi:acetyltransferase-like isoleucine patch superfamily enzyme
LREGAVLDIGADTGISGASICAAVSVKIGQKVLIGANVTIADTDFHAINPAGRRHNKNHDEIASRPVLIGDNVFIGAGSYILKGVTIGENSIIGANSVVAKSIPANVIAAGNPAKIVKEIRD